MTLPELTGKSDQQIAHGNAMRARWMWDGSGSTLADAHARVKEFLRQRKHMRGLDADRIASVHSKVGEEQADLLMSDVELLVRFVESSPARWAEAFAEPVVIELTHPGEDNLGKGVWQAWLWWGTNNTDADGYRKPFDAHGAGTRLGTALKRMMADWEDGN